MPIPAEVAAVSFDVGGTLIEPRTSVGRRYAHFATPAPWRGFPEVPGVLRKLRERGFRLAMISNWDDRLPGLLEAPGLAAWFDVTVVSGALGRPKPDPAVFQAAVARLGLRTEQVLHVGDDFATDVRGARNAGRRALWLRRGEPVRAADELADLSGLPPPASAPTGPLLARLFPQNFGHRSYCWKPKWNKRKTFATNPS